MAPSGMSQRLSRLQKERGLRALEASVERALRELPLSDADIAAVAPPLAAGLFRFRCGSRDDSSFFDIRGKVTAVCEHFAGEGLTLPDFVRTACRQPQLFVKAPASLIANVEAVVHHFQPHGLTLRGYLQAALKVPPLFAMSPATIIANVETVASRFAGDGLTLRQYLQACLNKPQLFCQSPATIIRHLGYLIEMYRQGLLAFPGKAPPPPDEPLRPLFALLSRWPICLTFADDNYEMRIRYAQVTGERPGGITLLRRPRRRIEEALAHALGNARPGQQ